MSFTHDTELALVVATALVNTDRNGSDTLTDQAGLEDFLAGYVFTGARSHDDAELAGVRALRPRLLAVWDVAEDRAAAAELVNALLRDVQALPQLVIHEGQDWHIHATPLDAPLPRRMAAEAAMALVDLVRGDELGRLRRCSAPDCEAVLVDLSRNRSRRFCDTGNCANRQHVAAYRARKASH